MVKCFKDFLFVKVFFSYNVNENYVDKFVSWFSSIFMYFLLFNFVLFFYLVYGFCRLDCKSLGGCGIYW